MVDQHDIRLRMKKLAEDHVALSASKTKDQYLELVGPKEAPRMRHDMLSMSGCALVARGFLRKLGLVHPVLEAPYQIGMAVQDIIEIGKTRGAWVDSDGETQPVVGDVVVVGGSPKWDGGVEHVFTIVDRIPPVNDLDLISWLSVDGGQRAADGAQCIKKKQRSWRRRNRNEIWDSSLDVMGATNRRVRGWIDLVKLMGN